MVRWLLRLHLHKSEQNGKESLEPPHLISGTVVLEAPPVEREESVKSLVGRVLRNRGR